MSVPNVSVRCCKARRRDRTRPRSNERPVPNRGGRYSRHRLTLTPGPPSRSSTTNGDILPRRARGACEPKQDSDGGWTNEEGLRSLRRRHGKRSSKDDRKRDKRRSAPADRPKRTCKPIRVVSREPRPDHESRGSGPNSNFPSTACRSWARSTRRASSARSRESPRSTPRSTTAITTEWTACWPS